MENTLSNDPASPSTSATPDDIQALFAPASAEPVPEVAAPIPEDPGEPAPVTTEPAIEQPVVAEPVAPSPEPTPTPTERELQLESELNQIRQERERESRERAQAEFESQRALNEEKYWEEVGQHASTIEDVEEKAEYYRRAATAFAEQNTRFINEQQLSIQFSNAVNNFPAWATKEYGFTPAQQARLEQIAASAPDDKTASWLMAGAAEAFAESNKSHPTVSPETTREAVQQSLAERANAEAAQNGVAALGGINGANPSPNQNHPPTSIRPGTRESHDLLSQALSQLR